MERERWQSYPLRSDEEKSFFVLLARQAGSDERVVTIETAEGGTRTLKIRRTLVVEDPGPASGNAVCRITFIEGELGPGERVREDLWLLASELLDAAESAARTGRVAVLPAKKKSAATKSKPKAKAKPKTKAKSKPKTKAKTKPKAKLKPKAATSKKKASRKRPR